MHYDSTCKILTTSLAKFLNLSGDVQNSKPSSLSGEAFDGAFTMAAKDNSKLALFSINTCQIIVAYSHEDWDSLRQLLPHARKYEKEFDGYFTQGFNLVWAGLAHYNLYRATGERRDRREGRRAHQKVKKWATNGTVMLLGPLRLMDAMESLCITDAPFHVVDEFFQTAFVALSENKSIHFEALGHERLAKLYLVEEVDQVKGASHLEKAIGLYKRWGALSKVDWLEKRYDRSEA